VVAQRGTAPFLVRFDPATVKDGIVEAGRLQAFNGLLHRQELRNTLRGTGKPQSTTLVENTEPARLVRIDADFLSTHVGKVHANLASDSFSKSEVGSGDLKGIIAFRGVIDGSGIVSRLSTSP
jgi:hypothetical protein